MSPEQVKGETPDARTDVFALGLRLTQVFLDTSAILALMNPEDRMHRRAQRAFEALNADGPLC